MQWIISRNIAQGACGAWLIITLAALPCLAAQAPLSLSAYRALGQPDLRQNGINMVDAHALLSPEAVAVDSEGHLFVADTFNHRVLGWLHASSFQNGEAAGVILGQPTPRNSNPQGIGSKGLIFPWSVAVDPITGDLYVADFGDNRVLRFPKPFASPTRVEPDAVYGQPDFTTLTANSTGVTA